MSRSDAVWLVVAVAAVSTSGPLVREAAVPALAIAFWRNGLAAGGVVPVAVARRRRATPGVGAATRATPATAAPTSLTATLRASMPGGAAPWALAAVAGLLLAAHFAAWISSLSSTTVAASVALVATQPVWAALIGRLTGERLAAGAWLGIAVALAGVLVVTGFAVGSSGRTLRGDVLALAGGVLAAAYVSVGAVVRRHLTTTDYTAACYSVAAAALLVAAVAAGQPLAGFDAKAWWCIVAITVGPQLLGHSVFNRLLRTVGATVVSVAVLGEIVGSALLAAWWFGERPPAGLVPGAACIIAGVVLVARGRAARLAEDEEVVAG
ncbi:MAG TPA: DMT family transporter [Acidimicrobiales bacterium]|nr:DMT family transporter [Acidimicrobiales bacterium]